MFVIVHRQKKYARRKQLVVTSDEPLDQNVIVAAKPPQPLPGSEAGPGLLAHVLVSKHHDHLPLHRQERILARHGVRFSRQTLCDWCAGCTKLFDPLVSLIRSGGLAIGRRNWLFVGSEQSGHTVPTILTLIATAIRHSLDPFAYLRDLLRRLPTTAESDLVTLLPNHWHPK